MLFRIVSAAQFKNPGNDSRMENNHLANLNKTGNVSTKVMLNCFRVTTVAVERQ